MQRKNHEHLVSEIHTELEGNLTKTSIKAVLRSMAYVISKSLKNGDEIKIAHIGNFVPFKVKDRRYRNVQTGVHYIKKAHTTVKCRIAKSLLDTVKQ